MSSLFDTLGVDWDADERTIKRAYAKLIKEYRPDSHPAEFARIREAYENALENARHRARWQTEESAEDSHKSSDPVNRESTAEQNQVEYLELESTPIAPYQRLPRNNAPELDDVEEDAVPPYQRLPAYNTPEPEILNESEPLTPPYQRIPSEKPSKVDDVELHEFADIPAFQYEFSMEEFNAKLDAYNSYPLNDQLIEQQLAQLTSFQFPQEETKALACFEAQIQHFDTLSLDQRMDYEDALGHWLLYSAQPSLLIFLAANKQFSWEEDHLNRIHNLDFQAKLRFAFLLKLAEFYNAITQANSRLLKSENQTQRSLSLLKTRAEFLERKEKLLKWKQDCIDADLPALQGYFDGYAEKHHQIFAVDIFFALTNIGFLWWIFNQPDLSKDIPLWVRACVLVTVLPLSLMLTVGVRTLHELIQSKPSTKLYAVYNWFNNGFRVLVAVAISMLLVIFVFPDQGVIFFILIILLVLGTPLFLLYQGLAKVEQIVVSLLRFTVDGFLYLEKTAAEITTNPFLKLFVRVIIYGGIPILLIKEYVPEMKNGLIRLIKSESAKDLFKRFILIISVSAYFIYQHYKK